MLGAVTRFDSVAVSLPVTLTILIGAGLRRSGSLSEGFWGGAERLTYYLRFPALLASKLAAAIDVIGSDVDRMGGLITISTSP